MRSKKYNYSEHAGVAFTEKLSYNTESYYKNQYTCVTFKRL